MAANEEEELPLLDRVAIRIAFTQLLQFNSAGRRASEPAVFAAAAAAAADSRQEQEQQQLTVATGALAAAAGAAQGATASDGAPLDRKDPFRAAVAQVALAKAAVQGKIPRGLEMLKSIPLPVIKRSQDGEEKAGPKVGSALTAEAAAVAAAVAVSEAAVEASTSYELTQQEERLVQVCFHSRAGPMTKFWVVYV